MRKSQFLTLEEFLSYCRDIKRLSVVRVSNCGSASEPKTSVTAVDNRNDHLLKVQKPVSESEERIVERIMLDGFAATIGDPWTVEEVEDLRKVRMGD